MSKPGCSVTLFRDGLRQPWGIRIVGGCDLGTPIVVTRACAGTPADGLLKPGDEVLQIGDYDARDLRHQDAQMLFKNAGNSIKLVVYRNEPIFKPKTSRECSVDPLGLPRGGTAPPVDLIGPTSFNAALLHRSRSSSVASPYKQEVEDELYALSEQPYRTTPLVLPGAKVKKDFGPTESYLRHHPNPMFRQAAPHPLLPHEIAMKQKVADTVLQKYEEQSGPSRQVVHKPYNTPIGLYSEQNIVDTINQQTGNITPAPYKKTVVYDPAKSETYRALQDQELGPNVQEVTPVPSKVFAPVKQSRSTPHPVPGPQPMNASHEEIQQSNTFKRLMYMVQSEGVY